MKFRRPGILIFPMLLFSQMNEDGVGYGAGTVVGKEEVDFNLRFHYFPGHIVGFGLQTNISPKKSEKLSEGVELNGHYIFKLSEHWGMFPIGGVGWNKPINESGLSALMGGGFHGSYRRFAPSIEYIYGAGFKSEGIFIPDTFFTIPFIKE